MLLRAVAGWVMLTVVLAVALVASVTMMVYVPAQRPVAAEVICPLLHK